jgi:hypothetical protein
MRTFPLPPKVSFHPSSPGKPLSISPVVRVDLPGSPEEQFRFRVDK